MEENYFGKIFAVLVLNLIFTIIICIMAILK